MRVALICQDKPGALQVRLDNRAAHLAYINDTGIVDLAGPFLNAEGQMTGSLVVLNVDSMAQAQAWADGDPYAKAGLFAQVTLQEWKRVVG
ncbi:MAG: YciI family protein [Paracoccaceae bacterium]